MKKNVVLITASLKLDNAIGLRSSYLVRSLKNKGVKIDVMTAESCGNDCIITWTQLASNRSRTYIRIIKEIIWGIELALRIIHKSSNTTIIFSLPPFISFIVFRLLCRGKRYITDVRDLYPEALAESGLISYERNTYKYLKELVTKILSKDVLVLSATQGILNEIGHINDVERYVYYNGYPDLMDIHTEKFKDYTVVFHGTFGKFQNIELLRELIVATSKDPINWILIGDGPKKILVDDIDNHRLEVFPNLPNAEVLKMVAKCHLGISLRTDDLLSRASIPVKVFEFIGLGVKAVVSPHSEGGQLLELNGFGRQFDNNLEVILRYIQNDQRIQSKSLSQDVFSTNEIFSRTYLSDKCATKIIDKL